MLRQRVGGLAADAVSCAEDHKGLAGEIRSAGVVWDRRFVEFRHGGAATGDHRSARRQTD
jgi:hypothetical protein